MAKGQGGRGECRKGRRGLDVETFRKPSSGKGWKPKAKKKKRKEGSGKKGIT